MTANLATLPLIVPDSFWGVVFISKKLFPGCVDRLNSVPIGLYLSLKVLVLLYLGLQVGRVLENKQVHTDLLL